MTIEKYGNKCMMNVRKSDIKEWNNSTYYTIDCPYDDTTKCIYDSNILIGIFDSSIDKFIRTKFQLDFCTDITLHFRKYAYRHKPASKSFDETIYYQIQDNCYANKKNFTYKDQTFYLHFVLYHPTNRNHYYIFSIYITQNSNYISRIIIDNRDKFNKIYDTLNMLSSRIEKMDNTIHILLSKNVS